MKQEKPNRPMHLILERKKEKGNGKLKKFTEIELVLEL